MMIDIAHPQLRNIPAVNDILAHPALETLIVERGRESVLEWVRTALESERRRLLSETTTQTEDSTDRSKLVERIADAVMNQAHRDAATRLGPVINATGVILHTSLGRAPLSAAAIAAVSAAAAACNLEVDLETGDRRYRGYQLQAGWHRLTGAPASLVVNNNAAATLLALQALCRGREVILSRGQMIEIGGSFRLPEIFAESGALLREVGTTNRTRLSDYENAIGPNTAAILRVHPSNYRIVGFAETPEIDELSQLAHSRGLLCIDDIGSGCLVETTQFGLPAEPTFQHSLSAGADLVLGSGDKLLGGPQCGILLGREDIIVRLREHPLARAVRVDKLTLAALTATLDSYLRGTQDHDIPTLSLLRTPVAELVERAERIKVAAVPAKSMSLEVCSDTAPVGGGSLPGAALPTAVLRLKHSSIDAETLACRLRTGSPRVFPRVRQDEVLLDLRSVQPAEDAALVEALRTITILH